MPYVKHMTVGSDTRPIGSSLYGTCDTAVNTAAKVATLAAFDKLQTGVTVHIKFTNSNTAANPTLKVGSSDAKSIMRYGTTAVGTTVAESWNAGAVVSFTYDGTNWVMNDVLNTWTANTKATAGYVSAPGTVANQVWKTDNFGNPGWRDDLNIEYDSLAAANGGTAVSLVTTGEKYTWNNKSTLALGTTATTAAAGNHTHALSIAASTGTNAITLAASTKYQLTAGGSTYIFTTPPNTNTWTALVGATSSANGTAGYAPAPPKDGYNTKYLRADGTWVVPPNTNTWTAFVGASASADGTAGYVPAPGKGNQAKFFRADGTWQVPTNTNNAVTQTATTTSAAYELLFSATADNTTRTEGARKTSTLTYNPSTKALVTGGTVNGYTVANLACLKITVAADSATSKTISNSRITANHVVLNETVVSGADVTWTTAAGSLTLECTSGIPAMTLILACPDSI